MHIGIIGGGMMGLTLALRLSKSGHRVTILETAHQLGGLATWFDYGDFIWDKYYHVILRKDQQLLNLIDELKLSNQLKWSSTQTGFLWNDRLISMSNHKEFLQFPAISLFDKCRLASGILISKYVSNPEVLESQSAVDWLTKIFGKRVYHVLWEPLLKSKYGVLINKVPASIMWATINRYFSTRKKSDGTELMGFVSGGYKTIFDKLSHDITQHNGKIHCNQTVSNISLSESAKVAVATNDNQFQFDRLISTLPSVVLQQIVPHISELHNHHDIRPELLGVIRLALVLKKPLCPYYVTNLIQPGFSFTGIIAVSSMTGTEQMNGKHLAMIPRYDVPSSEWFNKSNDEISEIFIAELARVFPTLHNNIISSFVHKERIVQALWVDSPPTLDEPKHTSDKRIWSVNAELAGRDTLNNNAIITVANKAAQQIMPYLK